MRTRVTLQNEGTCNTTKCIILAAVKFTLEQAMKGWGGDV